MKESMQDRVVVVTGGTSGIGRAAAEAFARAGATVVIAARGERRGAATARELSTGGRQVEFIACDVGEADQVQALIEGIVARHGRLDAAFNNAGSADVDAFRRTAEFEEAAFDETLRVNLRGVWLCMKYELQQMVRQGGGAIVNASSINGLGGAPQAAAYAAAKAGVLALTKSAALEYGSEGVRVNAVAPGPVRTPMLESIWHHASGDDQAARQAIEGHYRDMSALGRVGRPEEIADAVVWLCSEAASYVTGHTLIVDGGFTASMR